MAEVTNQGLKLPAAGALSVHPTLQEFLQATLFVLEQCELAGRPLCLLVFPGCQASLRPFSLMGCQLDP